MQMRTKLSAEFRRYRNRMLLGYGLFVLGVLGGIVLQAKPLILFALPGFCLIFVSIWQFQFSGLKCVKCAQSLGWLALTPTFRFSEGFDSLRGRFPDRIRFCPFCGVNLDDEI